MSEPTPPPSSNPPGLPDEARDRLRQLFETQQKETQALLDHIKAGLPELTALLEKVSSHWHGEHGFYRFYELGGAPRSLPSGWAAVLYLFNLR